MKKLWKSLRFRNHSFLVKVCLLTLGIILIFHAARVFSHFFYQANQEHPYVFHQDEGYIIGPVLKTYQDGYSGFRCRYVNNPVTCYGSTVTFLDTIVLHAFPKSYLDKNQVGSLPGTFWPYRNPSPQINRILRIERVVFAVFTCLILLFLGIQAGLKRSHSLLFALLLPVFPAFIESWQGMKNDYVFATYCLGLQFLFFLSLKKPTSKPLVFSVFIAGILGIGIKFQALIALIIFTPFFIGALYLKTKSFSKIIWTTLQCGVVSAVAFLALYPNLWVSSSEATWFLSFTSISQLPLDFQRSFQELWANFLPNSAPLLTLVTAFCWIYSKLRNSTARLEWILRWGPILLVPLLWSALVVKAGLDRPAYHLPSLIWSLGSLGLLLKNAPVQTHRNLLLKSLGGFLCAATTLVFFTFPFQPQNLSQNLDPQMLEPVQKFSDSTWWIDLNLRFSPAGRALNSEQTFFFDSLTQTPQDLITQIKESSRTQILISCWKPKTEDRDWRLQSPALTLWQPLIEKYCQATQALDQRLLLSFENGSLPKNFAVIPASEIKNTSGKYPHLPEMLSPRMLQGSFHGLDSWYSPLILYQDTELTGTFLPRQNLKSFQLDLSSTCKENAKLLFQVNSDSEEISLNVRDQTCDQYPWVCRLGIEKWWMKRYPISLKISVPNLPSHPNPISLFIRTTGQMDPERCKISLQAIRANLN